MASIAHAKNEVDWTTASKFEGQQPCFAMVNFEFQHSILNFLYRPENNYWVVKITRSEGHNQAYENPLADKTREESKIEIFEIAIYPLARSQGQG